MSDNVDTSATMPRDDASFAGTRIALRVDASLVIGSGHVMRCLTLANALRALGAECHFLCREHPGHLIDVITGKGFMVHRLPTAQMPLTEQIVSPGIAAPPEHADWLGSDPDVDAWHSRAILETLKPHWLVVDHYALDTRWEEPVCEALPGMRLVVIDDLADRPHHADLLLDQNLGRHEKDYDGLLPEHCRRLIGPNYALLRDEFRAWRECSLARRQAQPALKRLLITLGGVDKDNVTGQVLNALQHCALPADLQVNVIMGATAPWLDDVRQRARSLPCSAEVAVNVTDMARHMAEADLAIGAAGSTSWERCCLGLPTLMLVLADNQRDIAANLDQHGAAMNLGAVTCRDWPGDLLAAFTWLWDHPEERQRMSEAAAQLTQGGGATRLLTELLSPISA